MVFSNLKILNFNRRNHREKRKLSLSPNLNRTTKLSKELNSGRV